MPLKIAGVQQDFPVGDLAGNARRIGAASARARAAGADLVVFPELCVTGYPPEDLLLRPDFVAAAAAAHVAAGANTQGIAALIGHPDEVDGRLYNAASLWRDGKRVATYRKRILPNYGVFDERRYFTPGDGAPCVASIAGVAVGVVICEDAWAPGPVEATAAAGAQIIVDPNASPFHWGKCEERLHALRQRVRAARVPLVYVNLVGGQDELVFDGGSFVLNADGDVAVAMPAFDEALLECTFDAGRVAAGVKAPALSEEEAVYRALVMGTRDYIEKNGFAGAVLGLSGGIDSALTLCIAVDALGPERVAAVMMPSRFTSGMSLEDARAQAQALGVDYRRIDIEPTFDSFRAALAPSFAGSPEDVTEENLQARVRGTLLMALSNKTGKLVLTTGNKSEMAAGYATLYGDMAGGFAAIKDVPKTLVYRLAVWRNARAPAIPERVIARAPSAELRANQTDQDSLPPYPILDAILERYIEHDDSPAAIVARGFDAATVKRVIALVHRAEYKRRQAPPGVRVRRRAFGRDWRYPITAPYGKM